MDKSFVLQQRLLSYCNRHDTPMAQALSGATSGSPTSNTILPKNYPQKRLKVVFQSAF
jgi:hypothetical protein